VTKYDLLSGLPGSVGIPERKKRERPAKPRKALKARNPKRHRAEWARAYGSKERVEFVCSLPCIVRGCPFPAENAHTETGGVSRKADAKTIAPICSPHHRGLHHYGARTWEALSGIDLKAAAAQTERRWQAHINATEKK
jgi:hypothetical protein